MSEPVIDPAAPRAARAPRPAHLAQVVRTERLTPHMVRVVFGGSGLAGFAVGEPTDSYVKLLFPPHDAPYSVPYDVDAVKRELPVDLWPAMRTYTVRWWNAESGELAVDFVVHGDEGIAAPWAAQAVAGDQLYLQGPGGAYVPRIDADWHLFVGDDSALPAIAASVARLPAGSRARLVVEVPSPADEQQFDSAAELDVLWLHRDDPAGEPDIAAAVRALPDFDGQVQAFVHGDAGFVRELRRFLRVDKAVPREFLSISGYWKRGLAEDGWRTAKREWSAPVDAEEAKLDVA